MRKSNHRAMHCFALLIPSSLQSVGTLLAVEQFLSLPQKNIPNILWYMHKKLMQKNSDFLKGTLSTLILSLLQQNGKMYGYEICQKTKDQSHESILLTEGAIYPALHKLEKQGIITSSKEKIQGRMRKYYVISDSHSQQAAQQVRALHAFIQSINLVLKPQ